MFEVIIPKIEANTEEVMLAEWLKKEGDLIKKGEPLFVIETAKAVVDVESEEDGFLKKILVKSGEIVKVLGVVALIGREDEPLMDFDSLHEYKKTEHKEKTPTKFTELEISSKPKNIGRVGASPAAKKLAKYNGLDLNIIFGKWDRPIREKDVLDYLEKSSIERITTPEDLTFKKQAEIENLLQSKEYINSSVTVALSTKNIRKTIDSYSKKTNLRLTLGSYISKIAAEVLMGFPKLNAYYGSEKINIYKNINVGYVVGIDDDLVVPVVPDADKIDLSEFLSQLNQLILNAVKGDIKLENLQRGTFTITDLYPYGIFQFNPIINFKQSAILGICSEYDSCCVIDGKLSHDTKLNLILVFDHRVTNGKYAAEFLMALKEKLSKTNLY